MNRLLMCCCFRCSVVIFSWSRLRHILLRLSGDQWPPSRLPLLLQLC